MNRISHWLHKFFMRKFLRRRLEKRNQPGSITAHIGVGNIGRPVRKIFIPESVFIQVEEQITDEYGVEGREKLFNAGARMGRRFNEMSDFPKIDEVGSFKLKRFFNFFATYVETAFADQIKYDMNFEEKKLELRVNEMSVCRKTGIGEIFAKGVTAGAMSYLYNSDRMTSHQETCQGMGDEKCHIIIKPHRDGNKIKESEPLSKEYDHKNKAPEKAKGKSLNDLLKKEEFTFRKGKLEVQGKRQMIQEICMPELIEDAFSTEEEKETVFQSAKKAGREEFEDIDQEFVEDYLTGLGWGITDIREHQVVVKNFPWTYLSENSHFRVYRGLLSGLLSKAEGRDIELRKYDYDEDTQRLELFH